MCGIAGWIDYNRNLLEEDAIAKKMLDSIARRGPDAGGEYTGIHCRILHRRLAVVDIEHGAQPMTRKSGEHDYVLTYNGELYNTGELRKELMQLGWSFQGHSDTEVLLVSYCQWGKYCLDKLNGIFAFGIWDSGNQTLFLARDRLGVKPLFIHDYSGGLIFGSEIKALLANPLVKPVIDRDGLAQIFFLGPGRSPGSGVFKEIRELRPGESAFFSRDGLQFQTYWSLEERPHLDSPAQTVERTGWLIEDAITRQLVSDVPLCTFLSGGLDSSIITHYAAKKYCAEGRQLTSCSVDYLDNQNFFVKSHYQPDSDSHFIDLMIRQTGAAMRPTVLENADLAQSLGLAVEARDLPGMADIDTSLLLFCRDVKKDFTVGLSGECADEIFGGYPWFFNPDLLDSGSFPWAHSLALRRSILLDSRLADYGEAYVQTAHQEAVSRVKGLDTDSPLDTKMRRMFVLNVYGFMQTLLDRKDRMSMFSGLEVRVPFCDHRLVEYAYNMPWEIKSLGGREKGVVREAMKGVLPEEIVLRKKSPYPKTHHPLYFQLVRNMVIALFEDRSSILRHLISQDAIENLCEHPDRMSHPWYGQLMGVPQVLAYLVQIDLWIKKYRIQLV